MNAEQTRVAIYARYSSDRQSEHSIEDQLRICRARAEREGWPVVAEFQDAAISGATDDRPAFRSLQEAIRSGQVDIVLSEALDRISRDQEHVAAFHKLVRFAGVRLVTLSEGDVDRIHIGLKGTMNALFLEELGRKTRRGMEGRVRAGRAAGRVAYGYRRVTGVLRPDGEPERGLREIDPDQAEVVRDIFRDYAAGTSPLMIARRLNEAGIPAPAGKGWNPITIRGTSGKPGGLLRQRLYLGEIVWNRGHRLRDPVTGRSHARRNPASEHVIGAAPHLRIVDDELWRKVQERLVRESAPRDVGTGTQRFWEKRRPRHLLSGKLFCGVCDGPFSNADSRSYSCNNHRRGLCGNKARVRRPQLEARVLDVLAGQMMDPDLAALFAEEFALEWNRLAAEADREKGRLRRELADVEKRLSHLVEAIASGLRSSSLQAKLAELEAEKESLERQLAAAPSEVVRLMPNIGQTYRQTLARLVEALAQAEDGAALEAARALIERVVIHAAPGRTPPGISVQGRFEAMLMAGQPGLSGGMAETIARATLMADKGGLGGQSPPKGNQSRPQPNTASTCPQTAPCAFCTQAAACPSVARCPARVIVSPT
jgi:DNA invertase Pin-like site-specific DNA recombinase